MSQFDAAGIRPVAISVDSPDILKTHCARMGFTFPFLSDEKLDAIKSYDLVHKGAGENGADIARPAEFLIDAKGVVRWVNLTENFWVRARPEQVLEVAKQLE